MFQGHSKHRHDQTARTRRSKKGPLVAGQRSKFLQFSFELLSLKKALGIFELK
jgi:hypothetical protein